MDGRRRVRAILLGAVLGLVSLGAWPAGGDADEARLGDLEGRLASLDLPIFRAALAEFDRLPQATREGLAARFAERLRKDERRAGENSPHAVLEQLGAATMPPLAALLADPEVRVRSSAVRLLGAIAQRGRLSSLPHEIVPLLAMILADPSDEVRAAAVVALGDIGPPEAVAAEPALVRRSSDSEPRVRSLAAAALAKINPGSPAATPVLLADLDDPRPVVRAAAAQALGFRGPAASAAVPALTRALQDGDALVRLSAAVALVAVDPTVSETVSALARSAGDPHPGVRSAAVGALMRLGPRAAGAVPALVRALSDPDGSVRAGAVIALGGIGAAARAAEPALRAVAAQTGDPYLGALAIDALRKIGTPAP